MFHYWMSFVKVTQFVSLVNGDVSRLFKLYHDWDKEGRKVSLAHYFKTHI